MATNDAFIHPDQSEVRSTNNLQFLYNHSCGLFLWCLGFGVWVCYEKLACNTKPFGTFVWFI